MGETNVRRSKPGADTEVRFGPTRAGREALRGGYEERTEE